MPYPSRMVNHYFADADELRRAKERLAELEEKTARENIIVLQGVPRTEVREQVSRIIAADGTVLYSDIVWRTSLCPAVVMDVYDEITAES